MNVGGLLGFTQNNATITNCYNNCNISTNVENAGGLVGRVCTGDLKVINSFNSGNINSSNSNTNGMTNFSDGFDGGIVGVVYKLNAINLYNTGNIESTSIDVGGIVGQVNSNSSSLTNCYNSGRIYAKHGCAGGIIGFACSSIFTKCHNIGNVMCDSTSPSSYRLELGEIYGGASSTDSPVVQDCTYLNKTSNVNSNGATGKDDMTDTMSLTNFVTLMNSYVAENNADSTKTKLRTWTLKDGVPVFSNQ